MVSYLMGEGVLVRIKAIDIWDVSIDTQRWWGTPRALSGVVMVRVPDPGPSLG